MRSVELAGRHSLGRAAPCFLLLGGGRAGDGQLGLEAHALPTETRISREAHRVRRLKAVLAAALVADPGNVTLTANTVCAA
jgi:hypothetical protein